MSQAKYPIPEVDTSVQARLILKLSENGHGGKGWDEAYVTRYKDHDRLKLICHCERGEQMILTLRCHVHQIPYSNWQFILGLPKGSMRLLVEEEDC